MFVKPLLSHVVVDQLTVEMSNSNSCVFNALIFQCFFSSHVQVVESIIKLCWSDMNGNREVPFVVENLCSFVLLN
jgi:hypothetical protein